MHWFSRTSNVCITRGYRIKCIGKIKSYLCGIYTIYTLLLVSHPSLISTWLGLLCGDVNFLSVGGRGIKAHVLCSGTLDWRSFLKLTFPGLVAWRLYRVLLIVLLSQSDGEEEFENSWTTANESHGFVSQMGFSFSLFCSLVFIFFSRRHRSR